MMGHCVSLAFSEADPSLAASPSFSGALIGSGTFLRWRSCFPVMLPTIPGSVMEGLMSAAEPVYPRWSSASTTPEAT